MVRNFNELVLQQARKEDRVDRLGKQKAKEILDKKRERAVGLHRTGELFEPITKRLDIAHKYRKGERTDEEKVLEKARKEENDKELIKLIEDAVKKHPVVVEGPGAEGVVIREPGVEQKDVEYLKKMLDKMMGREEGVTEKRLGEMIDQSFQDIKNQVEAKPGGVSEVRLEQMKNEYVNELNAAIASIEIPSGITEEEVKKIVNDSTKEMKNEIKNVPGGITRKEVEKILEGGTKKILDRLQKLEDESSLKGTLEGAVGGVDTPFPEKFKLTPPGSPAPVTPSQQPMTSTPAPSQFDLGSVLQSPQIQPPSGSSPSLNPFSFAATDQEAEEVGEEGGHEGGTESSEEGSSSTTKGSDDGNATEVEESEGYDTEKIGAELKAWKEKKTFKDLKNRLNRSDVQDRVKIGAYPYFTGPYAFLSYDQLKGVVDAPEKERGDMSTFKFLKKMGNKPYGLGDTFYGWNEGGKKKKMEEFEKKQKKTKKGSKPSNTGSGLDDSLTESQRLKAFAIVKRNIGSANAGNTSKQSVQQTINAIQLLFLTKEITNQQRISLLQKLKSAINK